MRPFECSPRVEALAGRWTVADLLPRLAGRRGLVALDSAGGAPRRWSLVAFDPLRGVELPSDVRGLRAFAARLADAGGDAVPGPFRGGFVGALSYDLGVAGEAALDVPRDPWGSPLVVGGLYVDCVVIDESDGRAHLVLGDGALDGRAPIARRRDEIRALLEARAAALVPCAAIAPLARDTPPARHRENVERLRERIAAGDLFQANLAHRTSTRVSGDPLALYLRLRATNPAPYAGYLAWDDSTCAGLPRDGERTPRGALLSSSPELLFELAHGTARTRPIKGTIARDRDPVMDARRAEELLASAKDRAELAMIVDLARNDLGRCARVGSVRVEAFPRLESYARVHHLVADVACELAPGRDAFDVLGALFPGGSITGAPKLAAMAAIAALERAGRGFFTGSLGYVDVRGGAAFDILIRSLVWRPSGADGEVSFHTGGGITWSSDAAAEERETLAKGAALVDALGVEREQEQARETAFVRR